jgi:hypothetical protein
VRDDLPYCVGEFRRLQVRRAGGRVTLAGSAHKWILLLDNLEFAAVSTPERASNALLDGGAVLLGFARRRRG